jgi:hypothetical protein
MQVSTIYPSGQNQYLDNETITRQPSNWGVYQIQEGDRTIVYRHEVIKKGKKRGGSFLGIKPYQLVTDGQSGRSIVVRLPTEYNGQQFGKLIGFDEEDHQGEVCSKCGKGILLTDSAMVQCCNKHRNVECYVNFSIAGLCPFILPCVIFYCCYASNKKRLCTNCNEEFRGKWGICNRVHSTKEDMSGCCVDCK